MCQLTYCDERSSSSKKQKPVSDAELARELDKAEAQDNSQWSKGTIVIKATPETVWNAVHVERNSDPDLAYSKVLEQGKNESLLEQKFTFIPVFGSAVCKMKQWEVPLERIDYKMVSSDRFKAMEGSWVFTPLDGGKSTRLDLSTNLDMGIPVPRAMVNSIASRKIGSRLKHVKDLAENPQGKLAQAKMKKDLGQ
ncbi:MAG: SRPBCC family protein [Candidatus Obscuribacter sp.]|nr:SRPBCC family protein [Candidatus Obscuribacter sp.]